MTPFQKKIAFKNLQDITPLPGFQQAFGSTEIGRFSETFLISSERTVMSRSSSLYNDNELSPLGRETDDAFSPQWETSNSPSDYFKSQYNLQIGASLQSLHSPEASNHGSISTVERCSGSNHFSEIKCTGY